MASNLIPFGLGELFAGSNGMECRDCKSRTWHVWLTPDEDAKLKAIDRDSRHVVCEEKLGQILCLQCGSK